MHLTWEGPCFGLCFEKDHHDYGVEREPSFDKTRKFTPVLGVHKYLVGDHFNNSVILWWFGLAIR